jgi:hypothetical protein
VKLKFYFKISKNCPQYCIEKYDSNEWCFDGSNHVDGTLEGAMKAALKAYPV